MTAIAKITEPNIYDKLDSKGSFSLMEAACHWNGWYMPGGGQISFEHLPEDVLRFIGEIHDDLGKVAVVIEYSIGTHPELREYCGIDLEIHDLAAPELDRLYRESDREEYLRVRVAFDSIAYICVFDSMNFEDQGLEDYLFSCCDLVERVYGPLASKYIECLGMRSFPEDYTPPMGSPEFHSEYLGPASAKLSNQLVNCILWMTYSSDFRVTRRTLEDYAAHLNQKPMFLFPDERTKNTHDEPVTKIIGDGRDASRATQDSRRSVVEKAIQIISDDKVTIRGKLFSVGKQRVSCIKIMIELFIKHGSFTEDEVKRKLGNYADSTRLRDIFKDRIYKDAVFNLLVTKCGNKHRTLNI